MITKSSRLQTVGQEYHGFKLTKIVFVPEIQCVLRECVHMASGAQVMHLANQDPENMFCLSFQTLPYNSNGVAHILEHTVLCGSKKFPVKDPFFAMNRRSLNTFMNALTGADFTCYPAASQVQTDFYHLLEVYLDAVFHPLLNELSFLQEGHRLEFADPQDPSSPLEHKGIVYNEMKGALSAPTARLAEALNSSLFPDVTYGYNSGGDPKEIPELSYAELKAFHERFYHPSHCLFFFYGSIPLEKHLDFIAEHALKDVKKAAPLPSIPLQPRFSEPVYKELSYPIAAEENNEDKVIIAFGWLTCHILKQHEILALNVLEIILMDTDASPLKMALLKSGLCKQVSSFIENETYEVPWGITLKGCQAQHLKEIEDLIHHTLQDIASREISLSMIENAIHQLELYRTEITGDHAPFGLSLFMRAGLLKQHGVEPEIGLTTHALFEQLRSHIIEDPFYLNRLIEKHFINNPHRVCIVMKPDPHLGLKEIEEEQTHLAQIKASLTSEQHHAIVERAARLAQFQEEEENVDILPKVTLSDVPLLAQDYPLQQETIGHIEVFHHATFTNDMVYADYVFDLPQLNEDDLPYLRLFSIMLPQVGAADRDYIANLDYIQAHTGGLYAGIHLNLQAIDANQCVPTFYIRSKALHRKAVKMYELLRDTITTPRLENIERFKEILLKHFINLESRLNQSALRYATNLAASRLNVPSKLADQLYGLHYYFKIRSIVQDLDHQIPYVLARLQSLQEQLLGLEGAHLIITSDAAAYDEAKSHHFYGLVDIPHRPFEKWQLNTELSPIESQGRIIASPVAFISQAFATVPYIHPQAAALSIAAFLFDNLVLHTAIREQGGAYGGGAVSNSMSGNFYFYSYRDPNIASTLKAFKEAVDVIIKGHFDEDDLEEAKLEMVQTLDSPISPGSRGDIAYSWWREGKTFDVRQHFRTNVLALTKEEVIEATRDLILPQLNHSITIAFAGRELLEKENTILQAEHLTPLKIETI